MIKFIASDMDGTILLNGAQSVDADTLFTVKRCLDSGIIFAAASGKTDSFTAYALWQALRSDADNRGKWSYGNLPQ